MFISIFAFAYPGSITQLTVDFGDGSNASPPPAAVDVDHTYAYAGSYTVTLVCTDSSGRSATSTTTATTTFPPRPTITTTQPVSSSQPTAGQATPTAVGVGETVLLAKRAKTIGCVLTVKPDHRCSPGAYYSGLTKAVICSSSFHTGSVRNVPESEKHQVEVEYGMTPKGYGSTLEIDHIVSLELGGSNDIANLFPERAAPEPGYHVKDKLENKVHALVCSGAMTLRTAQRGIATNWEALYKRIFGVAP